MKKIFCIPVLLLIASQANAAWTLIGETTTSSEYIDISTARKDGDIVKVWVLTDWTNPQKLSETQSYLSNVIQAEFDCKNEQTRMMHSSAFPAHHGKGEAIVNGPGRMIWQPIPPGTIGEAQFKIVCKT